MLDDASNLQRDPTTRRSDELAQRPDYIGQLLKRRTQRSPAESQLDTAGSPSTSASRLPAANLRVPLGMRNTKAPHHSSKRLAPRRHLWLTLPVLHHRRISCCRHLTSATFDWRPCRAAMSWPRAVPTHSFLHREPQIAASLSPQAGETVAIGSSLAFSSSVPPTCMSWHVSVRRRHWLSTNTHHGLLHHLQPVARNRSHRCLAGKPLPYNLEVRRPRNILAMRTTNTRKIPVRDPGTGGSAVPCRDSLDGGYYPPVLNLRLAALVAFSIKGAALMRVFGLYIMYHGGA